MDFINLPLLLFLAVVSTGIIWLVDIFLFMPKRKIAIASVDSQYPDLSDEQKLEDEKYRIAIDRVTEEPALVEYSKSFFLSFYKYKKNLHFGWMIL